MWKHRCCELTDLVPNNFKGGNGALRVLKITQKSWGNTFAWSFTFLRPPHKTGLSRFFPKNHPKCMVLGSFSPPKIPRKVVFCTVLKFGYLESPSPYKFGSNAERTPEKHLHVNGKSTMNEDVFPIENGDFPTILLFQGWQLSLQYGGCPYCPWKKMKLKGLLKWGPKIKWPKINGYIHPGK